MAPWCRPGSGVGLAYNKNATRPAATAPMLTNVVLALPRNGVGVAVVDVVPLALELLLQVLLTSSKLAQARRVVFELWMLIERFPRKLPRPAWVDT